MNSGYRNDRCIACIHEWHWCRLRSKQDRVLGWRGMWGGLGRGWDCISTRTGVGHGEGGLVTDNKPGSQILALLAACRKVALHYNTLPKLLYVFEHKTKFVLIHAPYTRIVVFWHISKMHPGLVWVNNLQSSSNDFGESNLRLKFVLYSSNICEILLYNQQLDVITHELIYGVRASHR